MLTETLVRIPSIVIGHCSPASTPHWLQEDAAKNVCQLRLRYDFTGLHRLPL
jgi:hypothetical protein